MRWGEGEEDVLRRKEGGEKGEGEAKGEEEEAEVGDARWLWRC